MNIRATAISLVVASLGVFLVWTYLRQFEAEASGGPRVGVLVALHTIEPGAVLKAEDIGERYVPQSYVESRAIRATERERVVNLRASTPLQAQQTLMWTDIIAQGDDKRNLSSLVQGGMRAVPIHAEGRAHALVRPGDRVDIIATLPQPGTNDNRASVVLVQNVLVLGRSTDVTSSQSNEGSELVVSTSLQNAQMLAVASDKAKLSVALRGTEDVRIQEGLGDISSSSLVEAAKRAAAPRGRTGPARLEGNGGSR